jgi:hypothetical protein
MESEESKTLYHVLFITSHLQKDPNGKFQKIRIPGTYTSLASAKAAAYRCLFDAGYEREWFDKYETKQEHEDDGTIVFAVATSGSTYRIRVLSTPNTIGEKLQVHDDGRVMTSIHCVVRIRTILEDDEYRDVNVEGVFLRYSDARDYALRVLLDSGGGIKEDSFAVFEKAGPNQTDCGYGDNIIVHAVGNSGENFWVSIINPEVLESVRLAEAAF